MEGTNRGVSGLARRNAILQAHQLLGWAGKLTPELELPPRGNLASINKTWFLSKESVIWIFPGEVIFLQLAFLGTFTLDTPWKTGATPMAHVGIVSHEDPVLLVWGS